MAPVDRLASVLDTGPMGRLVLLNFVDSVRNGALCKELAARFILVWADECSGVSDLERVLEKLRRVRESQVDFLSRTSHDVAPKSPYVYTVLRYEDIYRRFHDNTLVATLSGIHTEAVKFGKALDETARQASEARILAFQGSQTTAGYYSVELKTRETIKGIGIGKLVWLSTAPPGERLGKSECYSSTAHSPADIARDNLGLVHYGLCRGKPDHPLLVALRFDSRAVAPSTAKEATWRPTAIDAESHSRFRGAYGDLRRRAGEWGRAIQLEGLSDRTGNLGAVEAVSPNFRPASAEMTFLGYPRVPRGDVIGKRDSEFECAIRRGRSLSWVQKEFVGICH